jgi:molybdate transport system permease protein
LIVFADFLPLLTPAEWSALLLSVKVALVSALAGLPFATAVGYLLARRRFPGRAVVEVIINLPLVLPPVVTGYLLLVCLAPRGPIGALLLSCFGIKVVFTWVAAALASAVVSFPLMVRAMHVAFRGVDPGLELAASSLGAGPLRRFFTVSLPLSRSGLAAAIILGFARSLGEFGATIMVAGNIEGVTRTLPLAIYTQANQPGGMDAAWRLVAVSVVVAAAALVACDYFERRQAADAPA